MQDETIRRFRALHTEGIFVIPNPWDLGSAKILASVGFPALATTSSGHAATLGRLDGGVTREELLEHAALLSAELDVPISADMENGFGDAPSIVAETIELAAETGLAGASIEDCSRELEIYDRELAVERVRAAVEATRKREHPLVLTARAENYLRGRPELGDTIERLQAFQEAGADVLYAPGLVDIGEIRSLVSAVDRPVNVLLRPGGPSVPQLGEAGVRRVSVGGSLAFTAYAALVEAAQELLDTGTAGFWDRTAPHLPAVREALRK